MKLLGLLRLPGSGFAAFGMVATGMGTKQVWVHALQIHRKPERGTVIVYW